MNAPAPLPPPFAPPAPPGGPLLPPNSSAPGTPLPMPAPPGGGMNGIPGATGAPVPPVPQAPDPSSMQYTNETQQDGSILIRVLNPDGSPGPVVKIVPSPMKGAAK